MRLRWRVAVLGMLLVTVLVGAMAGSSAEGVGNPGMPVAMLEEDSPWAPWAADRRYLLELQTVEGNVTPGKATAFGLLEESSPGAPWAADRRYLLEVQAASQ